MVKVPEYIPNVSLRPDLQRDMDVRATPEAFGADIGRGLQGVGRGLQVAADVSERLQALDDANRAKDADNNYSNWLRERMYGEGGYMTLEGRNAVDARADFEREAEERRKEFGKELTGGAANTYQTASQARLQSVYQQSIVHSAGARKKWFNDTSEARVDAFANDALENASNPKLVNKNIAAGVMEIREQGAMHGWDADTLGQREKAFVSGVHNNIVTKLAQSDPLAAKTYMDDHAAAISAADKVNLNKALEAPIVAERANRNVADIVAGVPSQNYDAEAPGPTRARSQRMGLDEPTTAPPEAAAVPARVRANEIAAKFVGMNERVDAGALSSFIRRSAGLNVDPRVTPWCAAFVNGVLGASGVEGTGKLNARSFLNFGSATDRPKPGDIVVLSRGDPNGWQGHVGFFQGYDRNGRVRVLAGNQSNGVNEQSFDASKVLGYRTAGRVTEQTAALPNYGPAGLADINARLMAIKDPRERKATQEALSSYYSLQKKQMDAQREQVQSWAEGELMRNPGMELTKMPLDYQQALGASGMTTLLNYQEKLRTGGVVTDERTLYDLQTEYANDPTGFADVDLFQYRDKLSNSDWQKVTGWRQDALTDKRKAKESGTNLQAAFSQAEAQLEAVGITTKGKKGSASEEASKQVVQFQNSLADEMETFKRNNDNRAPNQIEIQSMVNKLLLPIVIKTPGWLWDSSTKARAFEAGGRPDNSTVDVTVDYGDIPLDLRRGIALDLETELGRKPSQDEIVDRYEQFVLSR